jgi:hypothetical protein
LTADMTRRASDPADDLILPRDEPKSRLAYSGGPPRGGWIVLDNLPSLELS